MKYLILIVVVIVVVLLFLDWLAVRLFINLGFEGASHLIRSNGSDKNPYIKKIRKELEWLDHVEKETAVVYSYDGLRLQGYYIGAEHPQRIVLMMHGWRGSWRHDFGACARWFHDQGCGLLLVDQRAQGASGGAYMTFGIKEKEDCHTWLSWLDHQKRGGLPVYLYGMSMGASTVLMAAGRQMPEWVKGIIADCGFTSPYDMIYRFGKKKFKIKEWPLMDQVVRSFQRRAHVNLKDYCTLYAMETCVTPVLFVHGTGDTFVPCEMTRLNYRACTAPKQLLLVEGAEHCMSYYENPRTYEDAVTTFFGWEKERRN